MTIELYSYQKGAVGFIINTVYVNPTALAVIVGLYLLGPHLFTEMNRSPRESVSNNFGLQDLPKCPFVIVMLQGDTAVSL